MNITSNSCINLHFIPSLRHVWIIWTEIRVVSSCKWISLIKSVNHIGIDRCSVSFPWEVFCWWGSILCIITRQIYLEGSIKHTKTFDKESWSSVNIVQCSGYLTSFYPQLYRFTPLKTPFGLLIPLLQSKSHVTTVTDNYSSLCVTFAQLTIIHVRNYNYLSHSYTFTLADFSAINYFLKLSQTLHLYMFTLPVSVSYLDLTRRTPLKTDFVSPMAFRITPLNGHRRKRSLLLC
jgi:hypothetical protein